MHRYNSILLALLMAAAAAAQSPAAKTYFNLQEVSPGVFAALGAPGSGAGSNAGFVVGDRAVAVIDSFQSVDAARALLAAIQARTTLPIRYLINTHYHIDHVTGNRVFAEAGAVVMAQRNVRGWIHTENLKFYGPHPSPQAEQSVANLYAPDLGYIAGVDLDLGGKQLEVRVFPGHTGGDSAVRVVGTGVVFTGDLFWQHSLPNLIDASVAELLQTLPRLQAWPSEGTGIFVPGHGGIGNASDIEAFRGYLSKLHQQVQSARDRQLTGDAMTTAVEAALAPDYSTWGAYSYFIKRNIADMNAELAGTKRRPTPLKKN